LEVQERFLGGNLDPQGTDKSITQVNYFVGNNKDMWKSNVPTYNVLSLGQVWHNVFVTLKASSKNIEKIFTVQPGGSVGNIMISVDGINSMSIDEDGKLLMNTNLGTVPMTKPFAYQEINSIQYPVQVSYDIMNGKSYGFKVANYDN